MGLIYRIDKISDRGFVNEIHIKFPSSAGLGGKQYEQAVIPFRQVKIHHTVMNVRRQINASLRYHIQGFGIRLWEGQNSKKPSCFSQKGFNHHCVFTHWALDIHMTLCQVGFGKLRTAAVCTVGRTGREFGVIEKPDAKVMPARLLH